MTTRSNIKNLGLQGFASFNPSFDRFLSLLRRTLLATLLIGLIWLPGLSDSAIAAPQKSLHRPLVLQIEAIASAL